MAKLYFRYGAMNSGKSTALLQAAFNYEERGQRVLLAKPAIDTKGEATISSRLGLAREVDLLLRPEDDVRARFQPGTDDAFADAAGAARHQDASPGEVVCGGVLGHGRLLVDE